MDVLAERGYSSAFAGLVTGRSGISRLTFYELFDGGEACFLAAFDEVVARIAAEVVPAYLREKGWREQIRGGLAALLAFFDREPDLCSLVIVDALTVGSRVHEHRARVLDSLISVVDQGRSEGGSGREPPPVTAEGVVGAVFNVIHARVLQRVAATREAQAHGISPSGNISPAPIGALQGLCNPLMAMIVMPYLGHVAAARELGHPAPKEQRSLPRAKRDPVPPRLNDRALMILRVIFAEPGLGNRQIADRVGLRDTGHISRLLLLLSDQGLILNESKSHPRGAKAWRVTGKGKRVQ